MQMKMSWVVSTLVSCAALAGLPMVSPFSAPAVRTAWPARHGQPPAMDVRKRPQPILLRCATDVVAHVALSEARTPAQARVELEALQRADLWQKAEVVKVLNGMQGVDGKATLFNSSTIMFRRITQNEIQMLTRGVIKPDTLDLNGDDDMEVLNQAFYATLFSSMALSTVAATAIPDVPNLPFLRDSVLRFVMTIGIGGLPFAFLGAGLSVPGLLQAALIQVRRTLSEEFRERLVVHEAGHLLVAYCMGLPVAAYTANDAILNACQFFEVEDDIAGRIDLEQVDVLCAVSLGGVVAESIRFGDGVGGFADLSQLQALISRASPRLDDKQQMQRVRWGCVSAYTILKRHEDAFNSLVEAMGRGASIPECVQILEESGNTEE